MGVEAASLGRPFRGIAFADESLATELQAIVSGENFRVYTNTDVTGCEVRLEAERAATDPKVFTRIHTRFVIRGRSLRRNVVEQAVRLSHEKYCSATAMLGKTAEITREIEIVEA